MNEHGGAERERYERAAPVIRWLRRCYRTGAAVDGAAALAMLHPSRHWTVCFAPSLRRERPEFAYGMRAGAALMAGWTLVLALGRPPPTRAQGRAAADDARDRGADRKRRARTPRGHTSARQLAPTRLLPLCLLLLFGASYRAA